MNSAGNEEAFYDSSIVRIYKENNFISVYTLYKVCDDSLLDTIYVIFCWQDWVE